jgi:hypothetical protein
MSKLKRLPDSLWCWRRMPRTPEEMAARILEVMLERRLLEKVLVDYEGG